MSLIPLKKEQYMRLHADLLAKSDKRRLARRPERTEYSQTKAQGHALTYAFWVDRKFRDFLEKNPTHETCSKLHGAAWDLLPFLRKTQRISGERTQEFRAGGGRVFTDIAQLQLQTMLFWISALALPQFAVIGFIKQRESWVILGHGIQFSEAHMYRTVNFPRYLGCQFY